MATGELVTLSEQQLLDCDKSFNVDGRNGGNVAHAYMFILLNDGGSKDCDYPQRKMSSFVGMYCVTQIFIYLNCYNSIILFFFAENKK